MDEHTLRKVLSLFAVLFFVVAVYVGTAAQNVLEQGAPLFLNPLLCMQQNETYVFAGATSRDACSRITDLDLNTGLCSFYPSSKRLACEKIVDTLASRKWDCFGFYLSNKTSFSQGVPEMASLCKELVS